MKIAFIVSPNHINAACTSFYANGLVGLDNIDFFQGIPENISNYDIILIMTYDHEVVRLIKEDYPDIKVGLIDPRTSKVASSVESSDFIIVDSIEMEDFWRLSKKPILRYAEYPNIGYHKKLHEKKDNIVIGYHGNQLHLNETKDTVKIAISELGKKYNIEYLVMYNGSKPTGSEIWYPENVKIRHVNWSMDNYIKELSKSDIGIVPNNLLINSSDKIKINHNGNPDNYLLSFKMPSNPGRLITFANLGIPVVADFFPSSIQYLSNNCGYIANSRHGWYYCLEKLILSHELRQEMGDNLQKTIYEKFNYDIQNKRLSLFLESL